MGRSTIILVTIAIFSAAATPTDAQQLNAVQNPHGISLKSAEALGQSGTGVRVMGGRPAKSSDWRASFYSSVPDARCTAQLVGPSALLLAAHCVGDGLGASIEVDGKSYTGTCTQADGYKNQDPSADYALCKLTEAVPGIPFESVNINPTVIKKGTLLRLTGFGCTVPGGASDGIFRIADASVSILPGEPDPNFGTTEPNTIIIQDKASICPGDSGGGAYLVLSAKKRLLVSVNSRVSFVYGESYLSSLSTSAGLAFLTQWSTKNSGAKICGFNQTGQPCL
jgi:hypothetical protein